MKTDIIVSVIIPVYNAKPYVKECVDSILNEKIRDIEILLLDDESTDGSGMVCQELASSYKEVMYYRLAHGGVSAARNSGLEIAKGKYIFFIDADDRIEKGLLVSLLEKMEANEAVVGNSVLREFGTGSRAMLSLEDNLPLVLEGEEIINTFLMGYRSLMAIGGKMILRKEIGSHRFRADLTSGEDTFFLYDIFKNGVKTVFEYDRFYEYRKHYNNNTQSINIIDFKSSFTVMRDLYENEVNRVGTKKSVMVAYHQVNTIRKWMRRSTVCKDSKELRHEITDAIKIIKKNPIYPKLGYAFKINIFIFSYFWPLYKLIHSEKASSKAKCSGCAACSDVCPTGAIKMEVRKDGFKYPKIEDSKCINCDKCNKVCPHKQEYDVKADNKYYALQANDEAIRRVSTSGGAFRLFAEMVLAKGGVVIGASMNNLIVEHTIITNEQDLIKLQGSKYVQSETEGIFNKVKSILDSGKEVLFSGTPCQVDALRLFLGKEYSNLYLVDLICNGVTSQRLWISYIKYLERKYKSRLLSFSFRDKRGHDDGHIISAGFESGEKTWSMYNDKFCKAYFKGISIRHQCTDCLYCTDRRNSDVTIGDYWGVEKKYPDMNDGMGTSLVIVHSKKGKYLLEDISKQAKIIEISDIDARQPRLLYPASENRSANLAKTMAKYMPFRLWYKVFVSREK